MTFKEIKRGDLTIVISEGGVSVIGKGWDYTSPTIKSPECVAKMSKKQLNKIADAVITEYKEGKIF